MLAGSVAGSWRWAWPWAWTGPGARNGGPLTRRSLGR